MEELIAAEVSAGIPHAKILVAGFSQGQACFSFSLAYLQSTFSLAVWARNCGHGVTRSWTDVCLSCVSPGGATALLALRCKYQLAGVLSLSAYLPMRQDEVVSAENLNTPVLMLHGDADPTVKYRFGVQSFNILKEAGSNVQMKTYKGLHHSINPTELSDMVEFLTQTLM